MVYASMLSLRELRQDLHAHPGSGWKEFRTTALVAAALDEREFALHLGPGAVAEDERLGVPDDDAVAAAVERAREGDAPEIYLDRMGGITGLVAEKRFGSRPTVGARVDMDALECTESSDKKHHPAKLGFVNMHPNEMHACGHNGHTAIGLGIVRVLDDDGGFDGTLRLFSQPVEEGGRGGKLMSETDLLADIDHFLTFRLGPGNPTGTVIAAYENPLSNAKLDVTFEGAPSHAGNVPNEGRNALHTATAAVQNLYGIPCHADGATRINVRKFESPSPQNIIAEKVRLRVEARGGTADLNEYMFDKARRVLDHTVGMHDVSVETGLYGKTATFTTDDEMIEAVLASAADLDDVTEAVPRLDIGGDGDASYFIRRVQEHGGKATYVGIGASNEFGHHTSRSDIDEGAFDISVNVVCQTICAL